jgi:hypothetical protein
MKALIQYDWDPFKSRKLRHIEGTMQRYGEKVSKETKLTQNLISNF